MLYLVTLKDARNRTHQVAVEAEDEDRAAAAGRSALIRAQLSADPALVTVFEIDGYAVILGKSDYNGRIVA